MWFHSFRMSSRLSRQAVRGKSFDLPCNVKPFVPSRRYIFSDSFLGMDTFNTFVQRKKISLADEISYKKKILENVTKGGVQNVFSEDVKALIDVASSEDDLEAIKNILTDCLQNELRSSRMYEPVKFYFMQCLHLLMTDQARLMWNDPVFVSSGLRGTLNLGILYFTLLYRVELFTELLDSYKSLTNRNLTLATLAIAAAAKIGTRESFFTATEFLDDPKLFGNNLAKTSGGRINALYAFHGHKAGLNGPVYDFLTDPRRVGRPSKFTTNTKISILVDVGKLKEALLVARSELLAPRDHKRDHTNDDPLGEDFKKRTVFQDVMTKLTCAIREANDPELSNELASLCKVLDKTAVLSDQSMEDSLFEVISKSRHRRRHTPHDPPPLRNLYTRQ